MDATEALTAAGPRAALSHQSAARAWGVELLEPGPERLTVARNRSRLVLPGWRLHRHDLRPDEVELVDGVRTTTPLRTLTDLARVLDHTSAVIAVDSALRGEQVDAEGVAEVLGGARGAGAGRVRRVAAAVDPLSGSVLETILRLLLWASALPRPVAQFVVRDRDGEFVARVDFCWPEQRLVVEADGFAFHSDRAAFRRDRQRLNDLERLGWRVLRFSWEDVVSRPDHVLAVVTECLAATTR